MYPKGDIQYVYPNFFALEEVAQCLQKLWPHNNKVKARLWSQAGEWTSEAAREQLEFEPLRCHRRGRSSRRNLLQGWLRLPLPSKVWRLMGSWAGLMEIEGINCFEAVDRAGKEKKGLD